MAFAMPHPYTPYCPTFAYLGRHWYLLTFVVFDRSKVFSSASAATTTSFAMTSTFSIGCATW